VLTDDARDAGRDDRPKKNDEQRDHDWPANELGSHKLPTEHHRKEHAEFHHQVGRSKLEGDGWSSTDGGCKDPQGVVWRAVELSCDWIGHLSGRT